MLVAHAVALAALGRRADALQELRAALPALHSGFGPEHAETAKAQALFEQKVGAEVEHNAVLAPAERPVK
jgi:hypothetical protein